ncbi:hypothetical protein FRC12_016778 [Ceratobasidium sp. 428]|nr:hypothetical protein FRC12_016778 [Ceratobasidium sp. 428]
MGITVINSIDEFNTVINSSRSNVIDFWATGSGPCQEISPVFEELSEDVHQVGFYRVDFDKQPVCVLPF